MPPGAPAEGRLDTTAELIRLARCGDLAASERLVRRYYATLRQWAHGRLPRYARGLSDTDDLVQSTVVQALKHIGTFDAKYEGAFLAYLRKILLNQIRDEVRRTNRRPRSDGESVDDLVSDQPSPLECAIGSESLERYDRALGRLSERHQQAVILRVELGMGYEAIAETLRMSSPNAARMCVARALVRLAESLRGTGGTG